MDSFSLFENIYPSADNHVTGIVGLLAAAEALGKVQDDIKTNTSKDIMFAFLNGVGYYLKLYNFDLFSARKPQQWDI